MMVMMMMNEQTNVLQEGNCQMDSTLQENNIHRVLKYHNRFKLKLMSYIVCIHLGISPASDCDLPTFRNPLSVPSSKAECRVQCGW
jgi:hypothetical protein